MSLSDKKKLLQMLDDLAQKQREVSQCHDYYALLEQEFEKQRIGLANPEDYADLERAIATLNKEYHEKNVLLLEELNETLINGYDLSQKIGNEVAHDFKKLWDYMTQSMRREVSLERTLRDIDYIKKDILESP